jgi:mannose-6-phosphate isomerase-like protein (cupin superfamily)
VGDPGGAGEPAVGQGGGRSESLVETEPAEAPGQVGPGADGARNGHGAGALVGVAGAVEIGRRAPGAVEAEQAAVVPDEGERVAARSVVGRLGDREHGRGRERGVHGVAAAPERPQAGLGGQGMAGRDHGVAGHRRHAPPAARQRRPRAEERLQVDPHGASIARVKVCGVHPFDVEQTRRALVDAGGGYEVVHSSPGLEIGVYVLVAPEPDRQQPHAFDEVYIVLEGSGALEVEGVSTPLEEGGALFVQAGADHRFTAYEQLALLVIFNGPHSGSGGADT